MDFLVSSLPSQRVLLALTETHIASPRPLLRAITHAVDSQRVAILDWPAGQRNVSTSGAMMMS